VVSDLGHEVQQLASVLLPYLEHMAKRVVVAELELIRDHQAKLNQLSVRLLAVGSRSLICLALEWMSMMP